MSTESCCQFVIIGFTIVKLVNFLRANWVIVMSSKKGKPGFRQNTTFQSGSNDTNSIYYSADGGNDKINFY